MDGSDKGHGKLLYSSKEVQAEIGCGPTKVWELEKRGLLEAIPFDGLKRYTGESVRRLATQGTGQICTKRPPIPQRRRQPRDDAPPAA